MLQYGHLIERLLQGQFICQISDDNAFRHLQNEEVREQLDTYLRPLNRRLASNAEQSVWFLAWLEVTPKVREELSSQLATTMNSLLPLLEWFALVQETLGLDATPVAGDIIQAPEFVLRSQDNPSLRERVARLASDKFFASTSDDLALQIKQIFNRLMQHGYLQQPHTDRQNYRVTGKIDYLLDLVRFIRDEERLAFEEPEHTQQGLEI
ncbi:hypothetical protein VQ643_07935 [Pseudomonas sp. F1_0610]|uniref:condensin complex protein MksE n=1 Tax=Pseudomonas sp. F1_0610 TaxID=3114284 RepID=UPI0039C279AB